MVSTVFVTGATGYIGSHVCVALAERGYNIIGIDNFSNSKRYVVDNLRKLCGGKFSFHEADILDEYYLGYIFKKHAIDAVIHLAAVKSIPHSLDDPEFYFTNNCNGLINLINVMKKENVRRIAFSSSASVYGEPETVPIPEISKRDYTNPYALTKLFGEQVLEQLRHCDKSWAIGILRYFNPAGAHASLLIGEDPLERPSGLFAQLNLVASGKKDLIHIYGGDYFTHDGTGVRDYIHIEDLARGHVQSLERLFMTGQSHIVNLGSGVGYSVMDVVKAYGQACGRALPYVIYPRRQGDVGACFADIRAAKAILGFGVSKRLGSICTSSWKWTQHCRMRDHDGDGTMDVREQQAV